MPTFYKGSPSASPDEGYILVYDGSSGQYLPGPAPEPIEWGNIPGQPEVIAAGENATQARSAIQAASDAHNHDERYLREYQVSEDEGNAAVLGSDERIYVPATTFDTGWRDVSAETGPAYTGTLLVRRVGAVVYLAGGSEPAELLADPELSLALWSPPAVAGFACGSRSLLGSDYGGRAISDPSSADVVLDWVADGEWWPGGSYLTDSAEPAPENWPGVPWTQ